MNPELYKACENKTKFNNITWDELAKLHDIPSGKILKDRFLRARKKLAWKENPSTYSETLNTIENETKNENSEIPSYKNTIGMNADGTQTSDRLIMISENDSKTPDYLLNAHGYDPNEWELVNAISNFWNGMRPEDKGLLTLMQSKILVKPKSMPMGINIEYIERHFNDFKLKNLEKFVSPIRQYSPSGLVLELCLADIHINNESLTFEQIKSRLQNVLEEVKRRTLGLSIEEILVPQLGDIFHMDNYQRQTTSGTQVTSSGDYKNMFDEGIDLMIWFLQELSTISKIELINIQGNHDKISSYTLGKVLEAYFKENENIKLDVSHAVRKYRQIGISSVGWVHGDMPKAQIHDLFQKEARELFGKTRYSEIHVGHLHHEIAFEKSGVVVRYMSSITVPDEWHVDNGYIGARQGTQCFLWNKNTGLESIWFIPCNPT